MRPTTAGQGHKRLSAGCRKLVADATRCPHIPGLHDGSHMHRPFGTHAYYERQPRCPNRRSPTRCRLRRRLPQHRPRVVVRMRWERLRSPAAHYEPCASKCPEAVFSSRFRSQIRRRPLPGTATISGRQLQCARNRSTTRANSSGRSRGGMCHSAQRIPRMKPPLSGPWSRCSWVSTNPRTTLGYIRFAEELASHAYTYSSHLSALSGWTRAFLQ